MKVGATPKYRGGRPERRRPSVCVIREGCGGEQRFQASCACGWCQVPRHCDIVAEADAELHSIYTGHPVSRAALTACGSW